MVFPMAIRATFLMSGMLGLKLGLDFSFQHGHTSNRKPEVIEASVPFNITLENQTVLVEMLSQNESNVVITDLSDSETKPKGRVSRTFDLPGYNRKSTYDFALHGKCGPGKCQEHQMCVTWIRMRIGSDSRESPMMVHECLSSEGDYSKKLDPSGVMLCPIGEIHSVIRESQPCLKSNPPCPLVWKYRCVTNSGKEEIHSCKHKVCPSGKTCVEIIDCGPDPPCIPTATCV